MGYIYEDELKEILPEIMSDWIDKDDESWEWIFQEIEQKCHIGKRLKGKKWKKKIRDDIDELQYFRHNEYETKVNGITTKVDELSNKISNLSVRYTGIATRVDRMERDINAAKSMAQTAKQRTEVDYTKCADPTGYFTEAQVAQHIYNRMANRGATREELDSFRKVVKKYDATNYKPPVKVPANDKFVYADGKTAEEVKEIIDGFKTKGCKTCKYYTDREAGRGMHNSELDCYSIVGPCVDYNKWEAKDNG